MSDAGLPAAPPNAVRAEESAAPAELRLPWSPELPPTQAASLLAEAQPEQGGLAEDSAARESRRAPVAWRESRSAHRQASKYETDQFWS